MDSIAAQSIDDVEVLAEHIRVLVIFLGYVLFNGRGQRQLGSFAEGDGQDAAGSAILHGRSKQGQRSVIWVEKYFLRIARLQGWVARAREHARCCSCGYDYCHGPQIQTAIP